MWMGKAVLLGNYMLLLAMLYYYTTITELLFDVIVHDFVTFFGLTLATIVLRCIVICPSLFIARVSLVSVC